MSADLIVERHDVVPIIRPEQNAIAGVVLIHEILHSTQYVRLSAVRLHRILSFYDSELSRTNQSLSKPALDMNTLGRSGRNEADTGMIQQP